MFSNFQLFSVYLETGGATIQALPTTKDTKFDSGMSGNSVEHTNTNDSQDTSSPALNQFKNGVNIGNNTGAPINMEMDAEAAAAAAAAASNFVSQNNTGKNQIVSLTVTIKLDPRANLLDKPTV